MFSSHAGARANPQQEPPSPTPSLDARIGKPSAVWQALALNPVTLQTKLAVTASGDAHEQEAERFADAVASESNAHPTHNSAPPGAPVPTTVAPPIVHAALQSPATALDDNTRAFMEARLGANFNDVRLHTNDVAAHANNALNSRAFTSGRDIAFGAGQFAPTSASGRRLIAHELAHVKQQATTTGQVVQRAPVLSGRSTRELINAKVASDVDKALEESPTLKKYIDAKSLRTITGHITVDDPAVFASKYRKYAEKRGNMPDVNDVPGYNDRDKNTIELKLRSADVETVVHEAVHFNSSERFAGYFGHAMNEGMTEYFTEKILGEQKLKSGRAYRAELKLATAFVASVGEDVAAASYFKGDTAAPKAITTALSTAGTYSAWRTKLTSNKPADWPTAASLLTRAMGR